MDHDHDWSSKSPKARARSGSCTRRRPAGPRGSGSPSRACRPARGPARRPAPRPRRGRPLRGHLLLCVLEVRRFTVAPFDRPTRAAHEDPFEVSAREPGDRPLRPTPLGTASKRASMSAGSRSLSASAVSSVREASRTPQLMSYPTPPGRSRRDRPRSPRPRRSKPYPQWISGIARRPAYDAGQRRDVPDLGKALVALDLLHEGVRGVHASRNAHVPALRDLPQPGLDPPDLHASSPTAVSECTPPDGSARLDVEDDPRAPGGAPSPPRRSKTS